MLFFCADHHFFHFNIIHYDARPFSNTEQMHEKIIANHNEVVGRDDRVIFVGDFSFANRKRTEEVIAQMNGQKTFLRGDHDSWLGKKNKDWAWEGKIQGNYVFAMHWQMAVWPRSHYNSWNLFAHSHGRAKIRGKQIDVGIMNNNYYPFSEDQIFDIMLWRADNPNLIRENYEHI